MSDKEYKARLLYIDAGDCKEVWEVKHINGGRQYVGRDTFDEHTWWTLCDAPYGYCERSGRTCRASSSYFAMRNGIP